MEELEKAISDLIKRDFSHLLIQSIDAKQLYAQTWDDGETAFTYHGRIRVVIELDDTTWKD